MKITKKSHPWVVAIAKHAYPDYNGRKISLVYEDEVDTGFNANWFEGSRIYYKFVRLDNGKIFDVPDFAPWKRPTNEIVTIPQGCACVMHGYSQGYECGVTVQLPNSKTLIKE